MIRVICVGNRLRAEDSLGPRVFDELARRALPAGVEPVDGGTRGLDLLDLVERSDRVVFVDAVAGFAAPRVVVEVHDAAALAAPAGLGHTGGLAYLLAALPHVAARAVPWVMVGAEGDPDDALVQRVADRAVALAAG